MNAICKCVCGHDFSNRITEDDPDTNSYELAETECPKCGSDDFQVTGEESDEPDYDPQLGGFP